MRTISVCCFHAPDSIVEFKFATSMPSESTLVNLNYASHLVEYLTLPGIYNIY